jgi:hypothetical protein
MGIQDRNPELAIFLPVLCFSGPNLLCCDFLKNSD